MDAGPTCDPNATLSAGQCACNAGFVGDGTLCVQTSSVISNAVTDAGQASQAGLYSTEAGTVFQPSVPVYAVGVHALFGQFQTEQETGHLWDASGNLLGTVTLSQPAFLWTYANYLWSDAYFDTPILLSPSTRYVVSVSVDAYQSINESVNPVFTNSVTQGDLVYPSDSTTLNGVLSSAEGQFPTLDGGGYYFFVDLDYAVACQTSADCGVAAQGWSWSCPKHELRLHAHR